jgi:hypothetical protein
VHEMTIDSDISGSYGCPGGLSPFDSPLPGPSGDGGSLTSNNSDGIFEWDTTCPGGATPMATFTVTAALSPAG